MTEPAAGYEPIEDHALIGDLHTAALVSRRGVIDFACLPRFDSPPVFAALLDARAGGAFEIVPEIPELRHKQVYLPDSNVVLTRFLAPSAAAELTDFMPLGGERPCQAIVRRIQALEGGCRVRMRCWPRPGYAFGPPRTHAVEGGVVFEPATSDAPLLRLSASIELRLEAESAGADFELRPGETATFVLETDTGEASFWSEQRVAAAFTDTLRFWRRWIARTTYQGRWRSSVERSALALKLLISESHGSVVAAPTFGLPEVLGGNRNWDYRYTWIRDASFTIYALLRLGFEREAHAFFLWIEARTAELESGAGLKVLYGIDGRCDLDEVELVDLEGYAGSRPVRVGNRAHEHLQLDIYGELLDAVYLYDRHVGPISVALWRALGRLVDWVCEHWEQPDRGIWETRGAPRDFLHSRVMCWTAIERALRIAAHRSLPAPLEAWTRARDRIHADVMDDFFDARRGSFVQAKGSDAVDASLALIPLMRIVSARDPMWRGTLRAIEEDLIRDTLVLRYRRDELDDGLPGLEGSFTACTFWYAQTLARGGDVEKARLVFEKALGYANHVGLYAEELGPGGLQLGNFPQALSHVSLIAAACEIDRALERGPGRVAGSRGGGR